MAGYDLSFPNLAGRRMRFKNLIGSASYEPHGDELLSRGLYLDVPTWGYHVFEVSMVVAG